MIVEMTKSETSLYFALSEGGGQQETGGLHSLCGYTVHVCLRAHKQSTYTAEGSSSLFLYFSLLLSLGLCEFYRLFGPITVNHGIFSPPLNCYTITSVLWRWCLCIGWRDVYWSNVPVESWTNQSCLYVSHSAVGHRGQWRSERSPGQAEQRLGRAEQHLWKHVSVHRSYTYGLITYRWNLNKLEYHGKGWLF